MSAGESFALTFLRNADVLLDSPRSTVRTWSDECQDPTIPMDNSWQHTLCEAPLRCISLLHCLGEHSLVVRLSLW